MSNFVVLKAIRKVCKRRNPNDDAQTERHDQRKVLFICNKVDLYKMKYKKGISCYFTRIKHMYHFSETKIKIYGKYSVTIIGPT